MESMDKCLYIYRFISLFWPKNPYNYLLVFLLLSLAKEVHHNQDTKKRCLFSWNWVNVEFPVPEEKKEELLFSLEINRFPNESGILLLQIQK